MDLRERFIQLVQGKNKRPEDFEAKRTRTGKEKTLHAVGHAHIDTAWQWNRFEGDMEVVATWGAAIDILENDPDARFSASNAYNYDFIAREHPEMMTRIQELYKKGQWEPVGGMWIEADQNIIGTEAAARNALYGQRTFKKYFGEPVKVGFEPDAFGHRADGPARLQQAGIKYFMFMRPQHNEMPLPAGAFWWASPDGSKVLAQQIPNEYCSTKEGAQEHMQAIMDAMPEHMKDQVMLIGYGNHGGGLTREMLEEIRRISAQPDAPNVIHSTAEEFFVFKEKEAKENAEFNNALLLNSGDEKGIKPVKKPETKIINGALEVHATGTYTTESEIKELMAVSEKAILRAEKLATMAHIMGIKYPKEKIEEMWKLHLDNTMHDILPGDSILSVNIQAKNELRGIIGNAERIAFNIVRQLTANIQNPKPTDHNPHDERPFVAFNTHFSSEKQILNKEFIGIGKDDYAVLIDSEGNYIPYQDIQNTMLGGGGKRNVVFLDEVPQMGFKLYHMIRVDKETMLNAYGEEVFAQIRGLNKNKENTNNELNENSDNINKFGYTKVSLGKNGNGHRSNGHNGHHKEEELDNKIETEKDENPYIENGRFKLVFDPKTGDIISQYDKKNKYDVVYKDPEGKIHNYASAKMYKSVEPVRDVPSDAWDHKNVNDGNNPVKPETALVAEPTPESEKPILKEIETGEFTDAQFEIIEEGPIRTIMKVTSHWIDPDKYRDPEKHKNRALHEDSTLVRYYTLYNDADIGYYDLEGEFNNNTRHKTMKMHFPMGLEHRRHTRDAGLISEDRSEDNRLLSTLGYVYCSGKERSDTKETYGVGIISNKHGYTVNERDVSLTISSTPIISHHTPDVEKPGEQYQFVDQGKQKFKMRIVAGAGHVQHSEIARMSQEFNEEPVVLAAVFNDEGLLPGSGSFLEVDTDSKVVLTGFKKSEDDDNLILRMHNPFEEYADVRCYVPIFNRRFKLSLNPYEPVVLNVGEVGPIQTTDDPELNIGQGAGYLIAETA